MRKVLMVVLVLALSVSFVSAEYRIRTPGTPSLPSDISVPGTIAPIAPLAPGAVLIDIPDAPEQVENTSFRQVDKYSHGNAVASGDNLTGKVWMASVGNAFGPSDYCGVKFYSDRIYFPGIKTNKTGRLKATMIIKDPNDCIFEKKINNQHEVIKVTLKIIKDNAPVGTIDPGDQEILAIAPDSIELSTMQREPDTGMKVFPIVTSIIPEAGAYYYAVGGFEIDTDKGEIGVLGGGTGGFDKNGVYIDKIILEQQDQ